MTEKQISKAEAKIRSITKEYYQRKEIQDIIYKFSKNREISPRYFEGFGARPDILQYPNDVNALAKKGATSLHCSEEIWKDPLLIETGMSRDDANALRIGWDLLIDIDCNKGIKFSAIAAKSIIELLKNHGIKNMGIKFSGSKGFHIIVPYKAFIIEEENVKDLFPEFPRKIMAYIKHASEEVMRKHAKRNLPNAFWEEMQNAEDIKTISSCKTCGNDADNFFRIEFSCDRCGIVEEKNFKDGKGPLQKCYKCKATMRYKPIKEFKVCEKCKTNSIEHKDNFSERKTDLFGVMGLDLAVISPRHLFRMPYSLHEKTSLVSVVITEEELNGFISGEEKFMRNIADPKKIKVRDFMPSAQEGEAKKLIIEAKDWATRSGFDQEFEKKTSTRQEQYKQIQLSKINEEDFPPCIKNILKGIDDGKKRALFVLINLFRSIGMQKKELEARIYAWNDKCKTKLTKSYIESQLTWSYKRKPIMPQNCKNLYQELGVCSPDATCSKIKNPVNYVVLKNKIQKLKNPSAQTSKT